MCAEGDVTGIVDLLTAANVDIPDMGSLILYQDPLSSMKSGLHLAVEHKQEDVAWLLLWIASTLPSTSFPHTARQTAESIGLARSAVAPDEDIRNLQDAQNQTAGEVAERIQGPWSALLAANILSA